MDTNINIEEERASLDNDWILSEDKKIISKEFDLPDFLSALDFVREIGEDAEARNHHPDIHIYFRKVVFDLTTVDAGQLTDLDFQSARAIDAIYDEKYGVNELLRGL